MKNYTQIKRERIDELNCDAIQLVHDKTKAKILLLPNQDENKVFCIGFRTPSADSTGAAHILEHSVLCGSKKYPCKDPFIELAKGSLNTFLNAMTYPDKTVYPVASCNDKDFSNLVDVYLDAVFNPRIYDEEKIFRQEGWHYETDADGELFCNGVVYNEMKGVYSSVDGILEAAVNAALYPNHPYALESGGDPDVIPSLSYEDFKNFHAGYYHPSNSYIYLYGNCDMEKLLTYIDEEYLSYYEYREVCSEIPMPEHLGKQVYVEQEYPISDDEDEQDTAVLTWQAAVGGELDPLAYNAYHVLEDVLIGNPGAVLKEALIKAGIGDDIYGGYCEGIALPYFAVRARNTSLSKKDKFERIIRETLRETADRGLDRDALRASINVMEFRAREADYGNLPKGLAYGLQSFDSWLYDADPTMHIRYEAVFEEMKSRIDTGYYESLIRDGLLGNSHCALVALKPVKGLDKKRDEELRARMHELRAGMSSDELERIAKQTEELKTYQSEPSSAEALMKLPMLSISDLKREARHIGGEIRKIGDIDVHYSDIDTSGIIYLGLMYDIKDIADRDLPYVRLLTSVLGYIDTQRHTYAQLNTLIDLNCGGLGFGADIYGGMESDADTVYKLNAKAKSLYGKAGITLELLKEILFESKLDDKARLREIIAEARSVNKESLVASGHVSAMNRAGAFVSRERYFLDSTKGIRYYRFLERLDGNFDELADDLCAKLKSIAAHIFRKGNLMISLICDERGYEQARTVIAGCVDELQPSRSEQDETEYAQIMARNAGAAEDAGETCFKAACRREAWKTPSMVNYVARFGNFKNHGLQYSGALLVLRTLLNYDYLWNNIRVLGGAYGCSSTFSANGNSGFTSYRDPKLLETDEVYKGIAEYARRYDADEREMTKTVIGAVGVLDAPMTPYTRGMADLTAYLTGYTDEDIQRQRDEVIDCTPEAIQMLAPIIEAVMADGALCAIGSAAAIEETGDAWDRAEALFHA